jgi:hypothetical protein
LSTSLFGKGFYFAMKAGTSANSALSIELQAPATGMFHSKPIRYVENS